MGGLCGNSTPQDGSGRLADTAGSISPSVEGNAWPATFPRARLDRGNNLDRQPHRLCAVHPGDIGNGSLDRWSIAESLAKWRKTVCSVQFGKHMGSAGAGFGEQTHRRRPGADHRLVMSARACSTRRSPRNRVAESADRLSRSPWRSGRCPMRKRMHGHGRVGARHCRPGGESRNFANIDPSSMPARHPCRRRSRPTRCTPHRAPSIKRRCHRSDRARVMDSPNTVPALPSHLAAGMRTTGHATAIASRLRRLPAIGSERALCARMVLGS